MSRVCATSGGPEAIPYPCIRSVTLKVVYSTLAQLFSFATARYVSIPYGCVIRLDCYLYSSHGIHGTAVRTVAAGRAPMSLVGSSPQSRVDRGYAVVALFDSILASSNTVYSSIYLEVQAASGMCTEQCNVSDSRAMQAAAALPCLVGYPLDRPSLCSAARAARVPGPRVAAP